MTKDMETPAGLLMAAASYVNQTSQIAGSFNIAKQDAFIAGAEWQKGQWPQKVAIDGAFFDPHSRTIKIDVDAQDWENLKSKVAEFDLMRKDRDEAMQQVDTQAATIKKLTADLEASEKVRNRLVERAIDGPVHVMPADGFVPNGLAREIVAAKQSWGDPYWFKLDECDQSADSGEFPRQVHR